MRGQAWTAIPRCGADWAPALVSACATAFLFLIAATAPAIGQGTPDNAPALMKGFLDPPAAGQNPSRLATFGGWALSKNGLDRVDIVIDGKRRVAARRGIPRPDVQVIFPDYPDSDKAGFEAQLDLSLLPRGNHDVEAVAVDKSGALRSLGRRTYIDDTFRSRWSDLLAERGRRPNDVFYYAFGLSNLSAPESNQVGIQYAPYVSDTIKAGVRVPILYLRTTKGRANDWIFDPDFDTARQCGTKRITEDSLASVIKWSVSNRIPVLFTLNGGIWADATCDVPEWDINDHLEEDVDNCQWNENNEVMPDDYLRNLPGSQDAPELARALTLNVYAKDVRYYKKRNLQAAARAVADFARDYPGLFIGISLDPDLYLNPFFEGRQWYDYNPATLRQFREWLRGTGPYAGKGEAGVPDLSHYRRKKPVTLAEINRLAMKEIPTWDDVAPSRTFSLSRALLKSPWNALWEQFRRHLVDLHYDELSQWVAETGISQDRIYSTQGFDAPHPVTNFEPFPVHVYGPPKYYDTGGMSVEGSVPSMGHLGATLYGESAINNAIMEDGNSLFRTFRDLDPGWAVLEYNTANFRAPKEMADITRGYRGVRDILNYGAKVLSPMAWNGSAGSAANDPGFLSFTAYRGTPLEAAIKNAMVDRANLPRQARLWTFGGGLTTDDDDWFPLDAGTVRPGDAALDVTVREGATVLDSPDALDFRTTDLDALILGIRDGAPPDLSVEVHARARDRSEWRKLVGRTKVASIKRYRAGRLIDLPHSSRQIEQLRLVFRSAKPGQFAIERVALYPVAVSRRR